MRRGRRGRANEWLGPHSNPFWFNVSLTPPPKLASKPVFELNWQLSNLLCFLFVLACHKRRRKPANLWRGGCVFFLHLDSVLCTFFFCIFGFPLFFYFFFCDFPNFFRFSISVMHFLQLLHFLIFLKITSISFLQTFCTFFVFFPKQIQNADITHFFALQISSESFPEASFVHA